MNEEKQNVEPLGLGPQCEKENRINVLKMYEIRIHFYDIGCVIAVGCKNIAFSSTEEGMIALNNYILDPITERNKWLSKFTEQN